MPPSKRPDLSRFSPQHINLPAVHVPRIHMVHAMFHRSWPLGSEEGRAIAEHLFGPEPVAELPRCRFGYPRGWLHTFCRSGILFWACLSPTHALGLNDAFRGTWRGKADQEMSFPDADLLHPAPKPDHAFSMADTWDRALGRILDLPTLAEPGPAPCR